VQFRRGFLKLSQEDSIKSGQSVPVVEILEREPI
jgi:hypothetical protein